jgi:AcrR family transcriptional regulator
MSSGPKARAALLARSEAYILQHGLLELTLTALAEGIGSNRRMLLYHFGSLDALVKEAVGSILARRELTAELRAILHRQHGSIVERLDAAWAHLADPSRAPWHRIYFAQFGRAVEDPAAHEAFVAQSLTGWPTLLTEALDAAEVADSASIGRAVSALWSGLQIAMLSGADRPALAEAHHRAVCTLTSSAPA